MLSPLFNLFKGDLIRKKDPVTLNVAGIKCDAKGCTYRDNTVKMEDYKSWLNKPCPLCGANLLTQADFDAISTLKTLADLCNTTVIKQALQYGGIKIRKNFKVNFNGTGQVKFIET